MKKQTTILAAENDGSGRVVHCDAYRIIGHYFVIDKTVIAAVYLDMLEQLPVPKLVVFQPIVFLLEGAGCDVP